MIIKKEKRNKLELIWAGKDNKSNPEPRVLLYDEEKSINPELSDGNKLIFGDNLLGLKSLEAEYTGKIKCIYIDPPYNTGNAFEHYDDGYEHSIWLSLMRDRLEILRNLLSDDGSIFISIDDNEQAYLKVLMDEIFGRNNFITTISLNVSPPNGVKTSHANKTIIKEKEFIISFGKNKKSLSFEPQFKRAPKWDNHFNYYIEKKSDNLKDWIVVPLKIKLNGIKTSLDNAKFLDFIRINSDNIFQPVGLAKIKNIEKYNTEKIVPIDNSQNYFAWRGRQVQLLSKSMKETYEGLNLARLITDSWNDISFNNLFQEGGVEFKNGKKPEKLIHRIFNMMTQPGDIVLDSFAGSGTTGAVAHKMGRKWIMIEMGEHCHTHIIPRMQKVISGEDQGGISKAVDWKGGGGFKYYDIASSMIEVDKYGKQIISTSYNPEMLAEAMCKLLGYTYEPDKNKYWKQGYSSETNFIFTSTQNLDTKDLDTLQKEIGDNHLTICCGAFSGVSSNLSNITIKKIPQAVLKKCEWGKAGYPLPVKEDFKNSDFEFNLEEETENNSDNE